MTEKKKPLNQDTDEKEVVKETAVEEDAQNTTIDDDDADLFACIKD